MTPFKQKTRKLASKWPMALMLAGIAATVTPALFNAPTLLLWNASASVPIGLYMVAPSASLKVHDLAVAEVPEHMQRLAQTRRYLPEHVLLIKPVEAVPGTQVCRTGGQVSINGQAAAIAKSVDHLQRPLPIWQGCRTVSRSEIFLMNPQVPDSFDGRYFGPTGQHLIRGRAFPLLTFGAPTGH